jgi:hypothetical protein
VLVVELLTKRVPRNAMGEPFAWFLADFGGERGFSALYERWRQKLFEIKCKAGVHWLGVLS